MPSRDPEWEALYDRLLEVLAEFGENHAFAGKGDYWLIDDDYGHHYQKIEVANPEFWSNAIHQRVREMLASYPAWSVVVVFSEGAKGRRGFSIYKDHVEFEPISGSD